MTMLVDLRAEESPGSLRIRPGLASKALQASKDDSWLERKEISRKNLLSQMKWEMPNAFKNRKREDVGRRDL